MKVKFKTCEGCRLQAASFGLPADRYRKKRWCAGCAKAHSGAVEFVKKKKPARGVVGGAVAKKQEAKWAAQLARLAAYKAAHGRCSVPSRGA